ncbi:hypothetical protein AMECASPLE_037708, partial [Ameca splendens]
LVPSSVEPFVWTSLSVAPTKAPGKVAILAQPFHYPHLTIHPSTVRSLLQKPPPVSLSLCGGAHLSLDNLHSLLSVQTGPAGAPEFTPTL